MEAFFITRKMRSLDKMTYLIRHSEIMHGPIGLLGLCFKIADSMLSFQWQKVVSRVAHIYFMKFRIFSVCAPHTVRYAPPVTEHVSLQNYIVHNYVKILHLRLGVANKTHPLSEEPTLLLALSGSHCHVGQYSGINASTYHHSRKHYILFLMRWYACLKFSYFLMLIVSYVVDFINLVHFHCLDSYFKRRWGE